MKSTVSPFPTRPHFTERRSFLALLFLVCAPWGVVKLWRRRARWWVTTSYALLGLPLFIVTYSFAGVVGFASLLPELDLSVSDQAPRTIRYKEGNYASTFVETGHETHGSHEFIRVEVQPGGGNGAHYHRDFMETFTTLEGELTVHVGDRAVVLKPGETATAQAGTLHWFENKSDKVTLMTVRVTPARGLEKSIRVAYGLSNTGRWNGASRMTNLWRMVLLLGYSGTYLPNVPPVIQEPLVDSLARIAQWQGKDQEFQEFFAAAPEALAAN